MSKKSQLYEVSGDTLVRKNRFCPRCGEGTFMAEHSNRFSCGTCGYTEWKEGKDKVEPKPQPKPEPKEEKPKEEPKPEEAKPEEGEKKEEAKDEKPEEKPAEETKDTPKKKKK